jgi:Domain of unknown function (DUF4214)
MAMSPSSEQRNHHQTPLRRFFALAELLHGNDQQFVSDAYLALLGRTVDESGLGSYTDLLLDGKSRVEVLVELHRSAEGKANGVDIVGLAPATSLAELLAYDGVAFVSCAFQTFLCRPVDGAAYIGYGGQLRRGMLRLDLLREIRDSDEFKSKNALAHEIERISAGGQGQQIFAANGAVAVERAGDVDEPVLAPPASVPELANLNDIQFIHSAYQILLARIAKDEELEDYLARIRSGVSRTNIMRAINKLEEWRSRETMLHELNVAIDDLKLKLQPIRGRPARARCERLDRLIDKQKIQIMQKQLAETTRRFKGQIETLEKEAVKAAGNYSGKKRVLKIDQLSPFAQDIYFQIKNGLDKREEEGT